MSPGREQAGKFHPMIRAVQVRISGRIERKQYDCPLLCGECRRQGFHLRPDCWTYKSDQEPLLTEYADIR
jgi:hypothetical protein